jgi:hypothetical protein
MILSGQESVHLLWVCWNGVQDARPLSLCGQLLLASDVPRTPCTNVFLVKERSNVYEPMTVARLGTLLTGAADSVRWRLVAEFLEEYRWEPAESRRSLLEDEPARTGDEHWDVFLAALAEHVAARDGRDGPAWAGSRSLRRFWFPFKGRAARVDAVVHAPAAFRRRGVFVARQELEVA